MPERFVLSDTEPALEVFDEAISLDGESRPQTRRDQIEAVYQNVYTPLYDVQRRYGGDPEQVRAWLELWTDDAGNETALKQWESALRDPTSVHAAPLGAWFATRSARWELLAERLEIPVPDAFLLYRAVKLWRDGVHSKSSAGKDAALREVAEVVALWRSQPLTPVIVRQSALGSWSLSESGTVSHRDAKLALLYRAEVNFDVTFADKWVDDSSFLEYSPENEVIVRGPVETRAADIGVMMDGEVYWSDHLSQLVEACYDRHGVRL